MEKVTINGKEYQIDIEKCKEQGLLKEEKWFPKTWEEYEEKMFKKPCYATTSRGALLTVVYGSCSGPSCNFNDFSTKEEAYAFFALGRLIQLRDYWWDNMCDGWKPNFEHHYTQGGIYTIVGSGEGVKKQTPGSIINYILAFPTVEIRDKFFETYRDLIEEAKMFL